MPCPTIPTWPAATAPDMPDLDGISEPGTPFADARGAIVVQAYVEAIGNHTVSGNNITVSGNGSIDYGSLLFQPDPIGGSSEGGIYLRDLGNSSKMSRHPSASTSGQFNQDLLVLVQEPGTTGQNDTLWTLLTDPDITLNTTPVLFGKIAQRYVDVHSTHLPRQEANNTLVDSCITDDGVDVSVLPPTGSIFLQTISTEIIQAHSGYRGKTIIGAGGDNTSLSTNMTVWDQDDGVSTPGISFNIAAAPFLVFGGVNAYGSNRATFATGLVLDMSQGVIEFSPFETVPPPAAGGVSLGYQTPADLAASLAYNDGGNNTRHIVASIELPPIGQAGILPVWNGSNWTLSGNGGNATILGKTVLVHNDSQPTGVDWAVVPEPDHDGMLLMSCSSQPGGLLWVDP